MKSNELWMAFLSNVIVTESLKLSKQRCPACKEGFVSPLLHYHIQLSLLDKMKCYFEEVTGPMIRNIEDLLQSFQQQIHTDDNCINLSFLGQTFLTMATAESIYFGRYIDNQIDLELFPKQCEPSIQIVNESLKRAAPPVKQPAEIKKRKPTNKKKPDPVYNFYDYE